MLKQPFQVVASLILGNPILEMALAALPEPIRKEVSELRSMVMSGELSRVEGDGQEGDIVDRNLRGASVVRGDLVSGSARGVNLLRGAVRGGTLRACNVLQGDVYDGDLAAINVVVGGVHGGRITAVNLLLGDVHGGVVTRANLVIGHVYGGQVQAAVLIGDIHGGEVSVGRHVGQGVDEADPCADDEPAAAPRKAARSDGRGDTP